MHPVIIVPAPVLFSQGMWVTRATGRCVCFSSSWPRMRSAHPAPLRTKRVRLTIQSRAQGPRADHIGDRHRLVARGRYKERVVLLLGNRDLNKMRFTSELAESEIKFACPPRCRVFGRVTLPGAAAAKTRTDSAWRLCASAPRSRLDAVEGPHWVPKAKSVSPKMVSVLTACSPRVLAHRNGPSAFEHHR